MLSDYAPVLPLFLLALAIALILLFISRVLGPHNPTARKIAPYESGMRPMGSASRKIPVKFYRVGMLFILFDIEVIFFLPWAVVFRDLKLYGLLVMSVFFLILVVGFTYEWIIGGLEWE